MLRILVISLFVANLLLLGFQSSKPVAKTEPEVARSTAKASSIPTIHLFSEMIEDQDLLSGNRRCFTLGPFHSSEDKDEVRLLLQEVSTRTGERRTEALVEKGYWVFMPPYATLLEANEELLSLQALGLEDIGIIYDGDWKNAISLGYFLRQENALRRKQALQERGYEAQMRVQRQSEPRFWLDYEQRPGSDLIALDMTNRPNDFLQRSVPCPEQEVIEAEQAEPQAPVEIVAQRQEPEAEPEVKPEAENEASAEQGQDLAAPETLENIREESAGEESKQAIESVTEEITEEIKEETTEETTEDRQDKPTGVGQQTILEDQPVQDSENEPEENLEDKPAQPVGTGPIDDVETEATQEAEPEADGAEGDGTGEG